MGFVNWLLGIVLLALVIYSLYLLITGSKTKNLNKIIWALIIIFIPYIGIILYWIFEQKILK
jgi:hypothetical protein